MGYEFLLRPAAPDQSVPEEALVEALLAASASGVAVAAPVPSPAPPAPSTAPSTQSPPSSSQSTPEPAPAAPAAPAAAATPATAAAPAPLPEGPWSLRNGKGRVEARLYRAEGTLRGADLDVPFGGTEEELRAAFAFAVGVGDRLKMAVFDPQLATQIGRGSEEAVVGRWRESQSWMVDTLGVYDDNRSLGAVYEPPPLITRGNKVFLAVLGVLALLWWLWTSLTNLDNPTVGP